MLNKRYRQVASPFRHFFVWRQEGPLPASRTIAANPFREQQYRGAGAAGTKVLSGWSQPYSHTLLGCWVRSFFRKAHSRLTLAVNTP